MNELISTNRHMDHTACERGKMQLIYTKHIIALQETAKEESMIDSQLAISIHHSFQGKG